MKDAFRTWLRAARDGCSSAQLNLGYCYDVGLGVRRSRSKALYWSKRAFRSGNASAAHNIATVYRDRRQFRRSLAWFSTAVASGNEGSYLEMGLILLGIYLDLARAIECFRRASEAQMESDATVEGARVWLAQAENMAAVAAAPH